MGTIAPNPFYTTEVAQRCMEEIFLPTIRAMNAEGRPFKGCLYFGLMLTKDGPKVIEYNCRFGDPETQVVLPLLESDLFDDHARRGRTSALAERERANSPTAAACCVMLASRRLSREVRKGQGHRRWAARTRRWPQVFHSGTARNEKGELRHQRRPRAGRTATWRRRSGRGRPTRAYDAAAQVAL